jgi:hypothetical protein
MFMVENFCGSTVFCNIKGMMHPKFMSAGTSINSEQYWETLKM